MKPERFDIYVSVLWVRSISDLAQALKLINTLHEENAQLRQQVDWLKKQVFGGGRSEKLDKNQLGLGISPETEESPGKEPIAVPAHERKRRAPVKSKDESYAHLPIKRTHTILPG